MLNRTALVIFIAVVLTSPALAQPAPPQQRVTAVQVLQGQVGALAGQNAQLVEQVAVLQEQLAAAQTEARALKDKYEPKPAAPPIEKK